MADKRIHELSVTSDKSGKFLAVDEAGLPEALKFSADSLIDKAFTDTLYVKLAGDETVNGVKTWVNNGIFNAGITITLGGIDVTGNSNIAGTLGVDGALTVTAGGIIVTGASSIAGKLTISTGGIDIVGNMSITGTIFQTNGAYSITLANDTISFSRNTTNYIRAATVGGQLAFVTNGVAASTANANLVLLTTQESYFNNSLAVGGNLISYQTWPNFSLVVGGHTANDRGIVEVHGSRTADSSVGALSFHNEVSVSATKCIAQIKGDRDGDNNAGKIIFQVADTAGTLTDRMTIKNNGNVGIGAAVPSSILHIDGGSFIFQSDSGAGAGNGELSFGSTSKILILKNGYATDAARIHFDMSFGNIMTMKRSGEVGIGTEIPTRLLHVLSTNSATNDIAFFKGANASFDRLIIDTTNDVDCQLSFMGQGSTKWSLGNKGSNDAFIISKGFGAFGSSDFLTILSTGFVGISTTTPGSTLHVLSANSDVIRVQRTGTSGVGILFENDTSTAQIFGCVFSGKGFRFRPDLGDTSKDVVINDLGNVGIATAAPTTKLQIDGTIAAPVNLRISNTGGSWGIGDVIGKYSFHTTDASGIGARDMASIQGISSVSSTSGNGTLAFFTSLSGAAMTEKMRIVGSGLIGSGLIIPTYQLDIQTIGATDAYVARFYNDYNNNIGKGVIFRQGSSTPPSSPPVTVLDVQDGDGTQVGFIGYDTGSGFRLVDVLSSKKFKKNIKASKIKGVDTLRAVKPRNYKWKGRTPEEEVIVTERGQDLVELEGYIIEELETVMPDVVAVTTNEAGDEIKGYAVTGIIKYLHKAVLELTDRLEALET